MNPFTVNRGNELKRQVVRAALAGTRAARAAAPGALVFAVEPRIRIVSKPREDDLAEVQHLNDGQWHAWDMLLGRREPELGGAEDMLDVVGVNFDWNNQWLHHGSNGQRLSPYDERWRLLLRHLLADVHGRYRRPLFVAETSCEGVRRATWFRYAAKEVREALRAGLPVESVCHYPVLRHLGWDNDRYCPNGLLEMEAHHVRRAVHASLAREVRRQQAEFAALVEGGGEGAAAVA